MLDYPLRAWERNGGDDPDAKTAGPRTQRIKAFIKGTKDKDGRPVEGIVKVEMRELIRKKYSQQQQLPFIAGELAPTAVVAAARADYEQLHDMPAFNVDEREHHYREKVLKSPALKPAPPRVRRMVRALVLAGRRAVPGAGPDAAAFPRAEAGARRAGRTRARRAALLPLGTGIPRRVHAAAQRV